MDIEGLSRDLIRALRGERSQPAFSRRLGYRSNVVYAWEAGRRHPEASLFLRAAASRPAEAERLRHGLAQFFALPEEVFAGRRLYSPRTVTVLVQSMVGDTPKLRLGSEIGVDRTTLSRWCSGKTEPRLPEFLRLVQHTTQRLLQFAELFADLAQLPSTEQSYRHLKRQQRLAYELPMSHAVLRALELRGYAELESHDSSWLARCLGLDITEVEELLGELLEAGQIERTGEHYRVAEVMTVDTRQDPHKNHVLKNYWAKEAQQRFERGDSPRDALFSFNLFAISDAAFAELQKLHLAYYDRVRALVEASTTPDRVVLMNLQLLPLDTTCPEDAPTKLA